MPAAPAGQSKLHLTEKFDETGLYLFDPSLEIPTPVIRDGEERRLRTALGCKLRFVEDLDEKLRFEAKSRDWIEIWQHGRAVVRVYFGAFVELPAAGGERLLYCGCPELYRTLRSEVELLQESELRGGADSSGL